MLLGGLQAYLASESNLLNAMVNSMRFILLTAIAYALLTLALNLHWGYTGLFNIGIAGFMAVGAYATYILAAPPGGRPAPGLGLPVPVAILGGMVAAAIVGGIVALPALQLDADYFAIVTVGFSEIVRLSIQDSTFSGTVQDPNLDTYNVVNLFGAEFGTGGGRGIQAPIGPPTDVLFEGTTAVGQPLIDLGASYGIGQPVVTGMTYVVFLGILVLPAYYVVSQRLGNSPFGRVLKAIREDETVAQSLGKDTRWFKIKVFMLGAAMMGLAGILWRGRAGYINPQSFRPLITFYVFTALIIGGAGSNTGSVIGAIAFTSLLLNGPRRVAGVIDSAAGGLPSPSNFYVALSSLDPAMYAGYLVSEISALKFIFVGIVIVWLMQNRPEGMLGHRKEIASSIDLSERPETESGGGVAATDGGVSDE
ncbi:branched-chain amino acid ABC transporter permease [Halobacteriales archaeon QH_7_69_31]|nr:MAG: branched-chain amino acid ABC transporter permease [Halobacteriales archaeon QH_7_69_31]